MEWFDLADTIKSTAQVLFAAGNPSAQIEAEIIVQEAYRLASDVNFTRFDLFQPGVKIPHVVHGKIQEILWERAKGRPLQHLTGRQKFLDHYYEVNPDVLIPRPETEGLVSIAIEEITKFVDLDKRTEPLQPLLGLELGLGSGVISIELINAIAHLQMVASELCESAIKVGLRNATHLLGEELKSRLKVVRAKRENDVLEPFSPEELEKADFLISNPPYLSKEDSIENQVIKYEPRTALFPFGENPDFFYTKLARIESVNRPHLLFLEMPHERSQRINDLFLEQQWECRIVKDLGHLDRYLIAKKFVS